MIIVMERRAKKEDVVKVTRVLEEKGFSIHLSEGVEKTIIGAVGDKTRLERESLEAMSGVEKVVAVLAPYKLASREHHPEGSLVSAGGVCIGGDRIQIMAGPCAVESREQILETAELVKKAGARILRGGAFKPRTSPYSFQGLREEGLKYMAEAREKTGLAIVSEVVDPRNMEMAAEYLDIIQIGARNMQNFVLLQEAGRCRKPVLLKRGLSSTVEEWIMAAEYILAAGNHEVIMCERGIRTFETATRNTLDLSAVPLLQNLTHMPVIVDPSHGTGKKKLIPAMARAAVAAGADGLMIEVHPEPEKALSDGPQSLNPEEFMKLMDELRGIAGIMGRTI